MQSRSRARLCSSIVVHATALKQRMRHGQSHLVTNTADGAQVAALHSAPKMSQSKRTTAVPVVLTRACHMLHGPLVPVRDGGVGSALEARRLCGKQLHSANGVRLLGGVAPRRRVKDVDGALVDEHLGGSPVLVDQVEQHQVPRARQLGQHVEHLLRLLARIPLLDVLGKGSCERGRPVGQQHR